MSRSSTFASLGVRMVREADDLHRLFVFSYECHFEELGKVGLLAAWDDEDVLALGRHDLEGRAWRAVFVLRGEGGVDCEWRANDKPFNFDERILKVADLLFLEFQRRQLSRIRQPGGLWGLRLLGSQGTGESEHESETQNSDYGAVAGDLRARDCGEGRFHSVFVLANALAAVKLSVGC